MTKEESETHLKNPVNATRSTALGPDHQGTSIPNAFGESPGVLWTFEPVGIDPAPFGGDATDRSFCVPVVLKPLLSTAGKPPGEPLVQALRPGVFITCSSSQRSKSINIKSYP